MPKASLQFDLPEESSEFMTAVRGGEYKTILWNIDQMLRSHVKYGEHSPEAREAYQTVRDFLISELNDRGIDII